MSHDPAAGPATPGDDAHVFDLRDLARAAALLPPSVGAAVRREMLAEAVWTQLYPDDAALHAALAFIRNHRGDG